MNLRRPEPAISRPGAALFGLIFAAAAALLVVPIPRAGDQLEAGDTAPRTLEASHAAQFESEVLTEQARNEAAAAVPDVRILDVSVLEAQQEQLDDLFQQVRTVRNRTDLTTVEQRLEALSEEPPASQLPTQAHTALLALDNAALERVEAESHAALNAVLSEPVSEEEIPIRIDQVLAESTMPAGSNELLAVTDIVTAFAVPNFTVDSSATQALRDNARANTPPVVVTYSPGQVIANAGETLDEADIEALEATGVLTDTADRLADAAGGVLAASGLGLILAIYLYRLQPAPGPGYRRLVLTGAVMLGALLIARFAFPRLLPDSEEQYLAFALPIAAASMVASSFLELRFAAVVAIVLGIFTSFIAATQPELAGAGFLGPLDGLQLAAVYTSAGLAGAAAVHRAESISRYGLAAVVTVIAAWVPLFAFWLLAEERATEGLLWLSIAAAINGIGSAIVALGAFVILSSAFGVTTRLQLMELAQMDHPLMRRLQEEAPGTYHHSMMVGTLAERAATRIGADGLVARVGAYYHDIGKLAQPQYYIENMLDGFPNPHDELQPETSARLILDHVSNGLEIARRYRLPAVVRDFIPQHHGTRLVTYFYRRALTGGGTAERDRFRYSGPRPQTRESAIVMLADSAEAVVRATEDGRRDRIDELVDGVIAERLAEGQLDECDITMRDLQTVAGSFKSTFRAVYHPRIEYPSPRPEELAAMAEGRGAPEPASSSVRAKSDGST